MDWPPGPPFSVGPAALMGAATPLLKPPFFLVERLGISALDGVLVADQLIEKRSPGKRQSRSLKRLGVILLPPGWDVCIAGKIFKICACKMPFPAFCDHSQWKIVEFLTGSEKPRPISQYQKYHNTL